MPEFEIETELGKYAITADSEALAMEALGQELTKERAAIQRADQIEKVQGKSGAGDLFRNSFSFGLEDKVAGLAGGISGLFNEDGFSGGFEKGRRAQEIIEERARQRSGKLGTVADVAGSVGTGVLFKAPAALSVMGRMFQGGKEAAKAGALFGGGESDARSLQEFAGDVGTSTLIGGGLGVAGTGVFEAGRGLVKGGQAIKRGLEGVGDNAQRAAAAKVAKALDADGTSVGAAAARMGRRGTALINAGTEGENLVGLGRAISSTPGKGRTIINRGLDAQQRGAAAKGIKIAGQTLGGDDVSFANRVTQMKSARLAKADPVYKAAWKSGLPKGKDAELKAILAKTPKSALRAAEEIAASKGEKLAEMPTMQQFHYVQMGLRQVSDQAYTANAGTLGRNYKATRDELMSILKKNPNYKMATQAYADDMALEEALQAGRNILKPASTRNADQLAIDFAAMTKGEKELYKMGAARAIQDEIMQTPSEAGNLVKRIFGSPAKRAAIRSVFDSDAEFKAFSTQIQSMAKDAKTFAGVRTGSRTSFVDAERAASGTLADAAEGAVDAVSNPASSAFRGLLGMIKNLGGMNDEVAAETAKLLMTKDPDLVRAALAPNINARARQQAVDTLLTKARSLARAATVGGGGAVAVPASGVFNQ